MLLVPQNTVTIALLVGLGIVLLLTIRNVFATRRVLALLDEQSLAIQKLSAEVFEMQNMHSEAVRSLTGATQITARLDNELQSLNASVTALRGSISSAPSSESMQQFSKEIRRTLQAKEVTEFLDRQNQGG